MKRSLLAASLLTGCLMFAQPPRPAAAIEASDTQAVEKIVRDYLLRNPEVLVEALNALEAKRTAQATEAQKTAIQENWTALSATPDGTVLGNPDGDVTLVEFFDYNCGYCKRAAADMSVLLESDPQLKVVLKEIPVLGPPSEAASRVSLAFRSLAPEKYTEFQKKLLASRSQADESLALQVAADFGVETDRLKPLLQGQDVQAALAENARLSMLLGINGTPSYVVGDELVPGAVGADALAAKIANVRACGSATC